MEQQVLHSCSWDEYFMTMAYLVSMKSKDPRTRVGAVIVGPDNEIRTTGFNGLPRSVEDKASRYHNREHKLLIVNHAEENAILHCALNGVSAKGCTLYCPWLPCSRCAKLIIQAGITEVVYDQSFPGNQAEQQHEWHLSMSLTMELLEEAGVKMRAFDGSLITIEGLYDGKPFQLSQVDKIAAND
ncbi:MAG: dCMP deaminase family protein [Proteobacteria bacterium]|nr:dCMP deaminase family protein [Pseudomonadota bacterium]